MDQCRGMCFELQLLDLEPGHVFAAFTLLVHDIHNHLL